MGSPERSESEEDPSLKYLRAKSQEGIGNILEGILDNPEVKKIITRAIIRQSVETGIFLSCLIVGVMTLFSALKAVFNLGWRGDFAIGIILIIIGVVYVVGKLKSHR